MEHGQSSVEKFEKFTWKVENFSYLKRGIYSKPFVLGGYPWMIYLFPNGNVGADGLSIYLEAVETTNMSKGWNRDVNFKLFVSSQTNANMTITKESNYEFNADGAFEGFHLFITSSELHDPEKGFLVKDACLVGVEVFVHKSTYEKRIDEPAIILPAPLGSVLEEGESHNVDKLVDFKGLGQIEKAFVPLLEEVCSKQPSFIECQQKRSRKCREWAFAALGRVLYFLKTRKVKDMNDLACKDLQIFWEELELFSFDLTWLKPRVQSALGMKSYLEKLKEAEKIKNNVVALELKMETLKSKIASVEVNLHAARDLLEAQHLEEIDLDAELGFVKP